MPQGNLNPQQKRVLEAFLRRADKRNASPKKRKALVAAGLVEANLGNPRGGDRDSVGSLQERGHYGSARRRLNPSLAADRFLREAEQLDRPEYSAGELAQAVQRSAFPARYDQRGAEAEALLRGRGKTYTRGEPSRPREVLSKRTIPGEDNSDLRKQLILQFLQNRGRPDALPTLAAGLKGAQDTPDAVATTRKTVRDASSTGSTGGNSSDIVRAAQSVDYLASKNGAAITAKQEPGHASGGDHDPAVKGATARDIGGDEASRERIFRKLTRRLGIKDAIYKGEDINVTKNGIRYQIISRDHGTGPHLHVGLRYVRR